LHQIAEILHADVYGMWLALIICVKSLPLRLNT